MKVSASLYSWGLDLESTARTLVSNMVDYIHVDCNDDPRVFDDIVGLRQLCSIPVDLHLITKNPQEYFESIERLGIEQTSFQYEELDDRVELPESLGSHLGLAIRTGTDPRVFEQYQERVSFVMFMATTPGQSGGCFNPDTYEEIERFRHIYPHKAVHVDGGVDAEVGFRLKQQRVNCVVSGSFLAKSASPASAMLAMRAGRAGAAARVKDVMLNWNQLPIVLERDATLQTILISIHQGRLGFSAIVDENHRLKGVVADGDVRRALLKRIGRFGELVPEDVINRRFITIGSEASVGELLEYVRGLQVPIQFLPVTDPEAHLVGVVALARLLLGEL